MTVRSDVNKKHLYGVQSVYHSQCSTPKKPPLYYKIIVIVKTIAVAITRSNLSLCTIPTSYLLSLSLYLIAASYPHPHTYPYILSYTIRLRERLNVYIAYTIHRTPYTIHHTPDTHIPLSLFANAICKILNLPLHTPYNIGKIPHSSTRPLRTICNDEHTQVPCSQ
jgi:hypothetical protein